MAFDEASRRVRLIAVHAWVTSKWWNWVWTSRLAQRKRRLESRQTAWRVGKNAIPMVAE